MATMAEITAAINQIDIKKQNLHQSFLHLQSQSLSSNLPLNWPEIDSYFTTLQSSLISKFNLLQTLPPQPKPDPPGLISLCRNSDGLGLNRFIGLLPDKLSILPELCDAYRVAPDAPGMVLDVVEGFYGSGLKGAECTSFRSACLVMLEGLLRVKAVVSAALKDKAMEIAVNWKEKKINGSGENRALGFLLLVGAYGIVDRFSIDDIMDFFLVVANHRCAVDLCRQIVPANKINDMIQKFIDKEMHVTAVKFSIELQKTDVFSPVGLLERRKLRSMMVIEEERANAKDLDIWNGVMKEEISVLKSIIKCIDENRLESEYPKDSVVELVNKLQNELENSKNVKETVRKQPPRNSVLKGLLKSKKAKGKKINRVQPTAETAAATPVQSVKLVQESSSQKSDLSPDHVGECRDSPLRTRPSKQTHVDDLGSRKQPPRAAALKKRRSVSNKSKKSKKAKVNEVEPTSETAAATPVQSVKLVQESCLQKTDLSLDHVGECSDSPLDSGPSKHKHVNDLGLSISKTSKKRRSPSNKLKTSKKPTVNEVEPASEPGLETPSQNNKSIQESHSDHVGGCDSCSLESGPSDPNAPAAKDSLVEAVNKPENEVENSKQTVNELGSRIQPALSSKSNTSNSLKKQKVKEVEPSAESVGATCIHYKSIEKPHSHKLDVSPDHVGGCHSSPLGSGLSGFNAPSASPTTSAFGTTAEIIFVPRLQPPSDSHSNGWIWE